jgi:hypothetical protein
MSTSDKDDDAPARNWAAVRISTGFFMVSAMELAIGMCDTRVGTMAVRNVRNLLQAGCKSEHDWQDAIDTLAELCRGHESAHRSSGGWHDGPPALLAMAAAMEAGIGAKWKLFPTLHGADDIEGRDYKVVKYLMRAAAQEPTKATQFLQWLDQDSR